MKKAELILGISFLVAIMLYVYLFPGAGLLSMIFGSFLSMLYFYFGFAFFNNIPLSKIFKRDSYKAISSYRIAGSIAAGSVLSTVTIGLVFKLMSWPGANIIIYIGLGSLLIVAAVAIFYFSKTKNSFYKPLLGRFAIYGIIAFVFLIASKKVLFDYRFRNHPEYLQALKNSIADPTNKNLQEIMDNEYVKAFESD